MSRWEMFLLCFLIRFPRITKKQKTLFLSGTKNGEVYTPIKNLYHYKKKSYSSPTAAAQAIIRNGRVNGWHFWRIKNANGDWVKLSEY
jgi:hypothetical protein